jgi:hypothetical protein
MYSDTWGEIIVVTRDVIARAIGVPEPNGTRVAPVATTPEKKTRERARRDKAEGKAPTTQAGEFVREEIEHVREGKRLPDVAPVTRDDRAMHCAVTRPPPTP